MPRLGQTCRCGRHTWNGKHWVLLNDDAASYVRRLFGLVVDCWEDTEETRLVEKLLDGRLKELVRIALEEVRG